MKLDFSTFEVGQLIKGDALVVDSTVATTKTGKKYVLLNLSDGAQTIRANRWDNENAPEIGTVICITAEVESFQGATNLNVKRITEGTESLEAFAKLSPQELDANMQGIESVLQDIAPGPYADLANLCFNRYKHEYRTSPAAVSVHHNYLGGLALHTLEVMQLAYVMANVAMIQGHNVNMDLVLCGAFLHDIGKKDAYKLNGIVSEVTDVLKFYDHIIHGCSLVASLAQTVDMPALETNLLLHVITSHHGQMDWGSPKVPCCHEAFIVHTADLLSSKLSIISATTYDNTGWSSWNKFMNAALYNGPKVSQETPQASTWTEGAMNLPVATEEPLPFN